MVLAFVDDVHVSGAMDAQTQAMMKELRGKFQAYGLSLQSDRCSRATTTQGEAPDVMDLDGQQVPRVQGMTVLGTLVSLWHPRARRRHNIASASHPWQSS